MAGQSKLDKGRIGEALGFRRESVVDRIRLPGGEDFKLENIKDCVAE